MTDEYEQSYDPVDRQYVPPALRIAAVYPASDGRVPESIDVELNVAVPEAVAAVDGIIAALARVAESRLTFFSGGHVSAQVCGSSIRDHVYLTTTDGDAPTDTRDATRIGAGTGRAQ